MKNARRPARLALEDGTIAHGFAFGADAGADDAAGEVVFNTAITGYEEVLTDPSYRGQIVIMTAPQIGNVGWNQADLESRRLWASGFVVRERSEWVSNWRSEVTLDQALSQAGMIGIEGVDTRALTGLLRDHGAMRGIITSRSTQALDDRALVEAVRKTPTLDGRDLVREVTCDASYTFDQGVWRLGGGDRRRTPDKHVVAYDFGIKTNILRQLVEVGCKVTVVPAETSAEQALGLKPDGIFLSNGPGDPAAVGYAVEACRKILDARVPLFGICLGHQILGLALGGRTYKLKFGHHGANQPVMDLSTGRVEITSQNHGFAVDVESLAGKAQLSHKNLNDGTVEGIELTSRPAFGVQYHPEASPGPHDAAYLFERFANLIRRVSTRNTLMLSDVLDRVIAFAARNEAALVLAREEWAEKAGRVFDDDPLYEERTTAFLEWFALERPLPDGRVPAEHFLAEAGLSDLDGRWAHALGRSHRSLFAVRNISSGTMLLDDMLGGGVFEVAERRRLPGLAVDELFEARLVADIVSPPHLLFARGFQFHPPEAATALRQLAETAVEQGEPRVETLFRVMRLRLKALRYGHVAIARIYAEPE